MRSSLTKTPISTIPEDCSDHLFKDAAPSDHPSHFPPTADLYEPQQEEEEGHNKMLAVTPSRSTTPIPASPNIRRVIAYTFLNNVAQSVWFGAVWSPFVYSVFGASNVSVGWIGSARGIGQLFTAVCGGVLADKMSREAVLRLSGFLGLVGVIGLSFAVHFEEHIAIFVFSIIFGMFLGLNGPSLEALFADSVASGERTRIYSIKFMFEGAAPIIGFFLAYTLFQVLGNTWHLDVTKRVMYAGLALQGMSLIVMLFIKEAYALKRGNSERLPIKTDEHVELGGEEEAVEMQDMDCTVGSPTDSQEDGSASDDNEYPDGKYCRYAPPQRYIPYILATQDIIMVIGSGMTIMFFNLFMMEDYGVDPAALSLLNVAAAVCIAFFAFIQGKLGDKLGRLRMMLVPRSLGPLLLLYMALAPGPQDGVRWAMYTAYVLRRAFMNCITGASRAILMDLVPKEQRGRWNAIQCVQNCSWSGSGFAGGYIADRYGYKSSFIVTCSFHFSALFILSLGSFTKDTRLTPRNSDGDNGDADDEQA